LKRKFIHTLEIYSIELSMLRQTRESYQRELQNLQIMRSQELVMSRQPQAGAHSTANYAQFHHYATFSSFSNYFRSGKHYLNYFKPMMDHRKIDDK